jgi:hypothetical protein
VCKNSVVTWVVFLGIHILEKPILFLACYHLYHSANTQHEGQMHKSTVGLCVDWQFINPLAPTCQLCPSRTVMLKMPNVKYRWQPFNSLPHAAVT